MTASILKAAMIGSRICIQNRATKSITPRILPSLFNQRIPFTLYKSLATSSTSTTTQYHTRPFKILGLQQIAIGSLNNKSSLSNLWTNILGVPKVGTYKSTKENVDEDILILGKKENDNNPLATVEIDLMTPLDETKSPKVHIPPLNHIGLWVDDLPKAVEWMQSVGVRFTPGGVSYLHYWLSTCLKLSLMLISFFLFIYR